MALVHVVFLDAATGAMLQYGDLPEAELARQDMTGRIMVRLPESAIVRNVVDGMTVLGLDLDLFRPAARDYVDAAAGAFRARFITDVPGQAQTYEKKEAEARLWTSGDEAANPDRYPFMIAEAVVRGVPVMQVRGEIMAQVNQLTPIAALIEAHRVAAKMDIQTATNVPAIVAAMQVDWEALLP